MKRTAIEDYKEIVETVQKYIDGCNEGKSEIMNPAFDNGAVMYGTKPNGEIEAQGSIENLYGIVDTVGADKGGKARVDVLDTTEYTAVVRVIIENWHGLTFTDYLLLMKMNGEWKMVAKVYYTHAE